MRFLKLAAAIAVGALLLEMSGEAMAAKIRKRGPAVVTENSDPDFLAMIGSVMPFSPEEAEKFHHSAPKQLGPKYLNATPQPMRAGRNRVSLGGGGQNTPYGFPGSNYPDDAVGFYKDNFVTYTNSPLSGYYGWYGQISP